METDETFRLKRKSILEILRSYLHKEVSFLIYEPFGNVVLNYSIGNEAISDTEMCVLKALLGERRGQSFQIKIFGSKYETVLSPGGLLIGRGLDSDLGARRVQLPVPIIKIGHTEETLEHTKIGGKRDVDEHETCEALEKLHNNCGSLNGKNNQTSLEMLPQDSANKLSDKIERSNSENNSTSGLLFLGSPIYSSAVRTFRSSTYTYIPSTVLITPEYVCFTTHLADVLRRESFWFELHVVKAPNTLFVVERHHVELYYGSFWKFSASKLKARFNITRCYRDRSVEPHGLLDTLSQELKLGQTGKLPADRNESTSFLISRRESPTPSSSRAVSRTSRKSTYRLPPTFSPSS
ncbi:hypothetical protein MAR_017493 [Mya arenaria]|uniref:Uncharacterized protein n=1 Tax=Mya arenaria TaxID=6604 RepID=A0ABY7EBX8_MYAAR|nr:hypothetical protein MAR_017493 [Mya arenaria]